MSRNKMTQKTKRRRPSKTASRLIKNLDSLESKGLLSGEGKEPVRVLLVESDDSATDLYTGLIHDVAHVQIDMIRFIENSYELIVRGTYALVILGKDPDLSVLERIRGLSPSTSVIVLSETGSVEDAVKAIRSGAEDYLEKPFRPESFKLAVKRGLDRREVLGQDQQTRSLLNLVNCCQMISSSLDPERMLRIVKSYLTRELKTHHTAFYKRAGNGIQKISLSSLGNDDRAMEEVLDIAVASQDPFALIESSVSDFIFLERGTLTPGLFIFQFSFLGGQPCCVVSLSPEVPADRDAFGAQLSILNRQISATIQTMDQFIEVENLVYVDEVTGLYNTRYMNTVLDREIRLADQKKKSFAVLFIDVDHFKSVNDTYGHLVGSKLLNNLGRHLKNYVREGDTVFRYGGDEFVAVLTKTDLKTALKIAERIRQSVEGRKFLESEGVPAEFTVSIGVALYPIHAKSKKAVIEVADEAMYAAKKRSRNCVTVIEKFTTAKKGK